MTAMAPSFSHDKAPQYHTTAKQREALVSHAKANPHTKIPIDWVIDIADSNNGWFYGIACDYNDETQELHVMVPDRENPTFDGFVRLDYQSLHLIECCDQASAALFNKIVRDSIIDVKWDIEREDPEMGNWIRSSGKHFIRMTNEIVYQDNDGNEDHIEYATVIADKSLRLVQCHRFRSKARADFIRLIQDDIVASATYALEEASIPWNKALKSIENISKTKVLANFEANTVKIRQQALQTADQLNTSNKVEAMTNNLLSISVGTNTNKENAKVAVGLRKEKAEAETIYYGAYPQGENFKHENPLASKATKSFPKKSHPTIYKFHWLR